MAIVIYLVILGLFAGLMLRTGGQELPAQITETGLQRRFLKMAAYLWHFRKKRTGLLLWPGVRRDLQIMQPETPADTAEKIYFIRKTAKVLLLLFAGSLVCLFVSLSAYTQNRVSGEGQIRRQEYSGNDIQMQLTAQSDTGDKNGNYELKIGAREYTDEEADSLFQKASAQMEKLMLGTNTSPDEVHSDLTLLSSVQGYPFKITWKPDSYDFLHADGTLQTGQEIPPQGKTVMLTATYEYRERKWEQVLYVRILPPRLSGKERMHKELQELLQRTEAGSREQEYLTLPKSFQGHAVRWKELTQDNSLYLLALILISAVLIYIAADRELHGKVQRRQEELLLSYPQFVSQLVLYMGAGMTLRNVIIRLSGDYTRRKAQGERRQYLYEELCRVGHEMDGGISEMTAIEHFAGRCGAQEYIRVCSLLTQNQKKGNSELLKLLREEADKAASQRLDHARKLGEQAGTKLLLPMMLMLAIVMVLIMVPAYRSF